MSRVIASKGKKAQPNTKPDPKLLASAAKSGKQIAKKLEGVALPAEPIVTAPAAPARQDDGKAFSKDDLQRLEVLQLRMRAAQQAVELHNKALDVFLRDANEKIRVAKLEIEAKQNEAQRHATALQALYIELESRYSVKMREITYDPASGKIMTAPPGLLDQA